MKQILWAVPLAAAAVLLTTLPSSADDTTDDVHCYIISLQMLQSKDPKEQMAGVFAHGYWLGRLNGRTPSLNMEDRVLEELPKMVGDVFRAEATRCGQEMIARGQAEKAMGEDMQARGRKMMQDENSR